MHRQILSAVLLLAGCLLLGGCAHSETSDAHQYSADSWRELIGDSCRHFYDGCNTCTRAPDAAQAACTRKACLRYEAPHCLDEAASRQILDYVCDGGKRFRVYMGEYAVDDQKVRLKANQIMFADAQTRTSSLLTREPSASGAKYASDHFSYWAKGDAARTEVAGAILYTGCLLSR